MNKTKTKHVQFVALHAEPRAAIMAPHSAKVRASPGETDNSALLRLAGVVCAPQNPTCCLLAAKQDIHSSGENCYTMFHRRVFERNGEEGWQIQQGHSWDMSTQDTMAALAQASP